MIKTINTYKKFKMNSSYFECPEEDIDVCDFQADPIDFEVQEPLPFENHDFQDMYNVS